MLDGHMLRAYYDLCFPLLDFCTWLGYGKVPVEHAGVSSAFAYREFSFMWDGGYFTRFKCFQHSGELRGYLLDKIPERIDLGAIYSCDPSQKLLSPEVVGREYVIDIDLTDMGPQLFTTRDDPSDASFKLSWSFLVAAVTVLDGILRREFGFKHLLWVWSGKKGVHCWVCDKRARDLSFQARAAITTFLQLDRASDNCRADGSPPYLMFETSAKLLRESGLFERLLVEQEWLSPGRRFVVLDCIPNEDLCLEIEQRLDAVAADLRTKQDFLWKTFCKVVRQWAQRTQRNKWKKDDLAGNIINKIVLKLCYPVLDANVSKDPKHLLKSPFVVHPGTGRVCVPLDPEEISDMDPGTLPTLPEVWADRALLQPYKDFFAKKFLRGLYMECARERLERHRW